MWVMMCLLSFSSSPSPNPVPLLLPTAVGGGECTGIGLVPKGSVEQPWHDVLTVCSLSHARVMKIFKISLSDNHAVKNCLLLRFFCEKQSCLHALSS